MAVKKIGVGAGIGTVDYADLVAWDAYLNALGAFAADETGRILWASSANELIVTASQILDGSTPGSFNIFLEAGDSAGNQGGSFKDNANRLTNALRYNPANGAAVRVNIGSGGKIQLLDANIKVRNLQFKALVTNDFFNNNSADAGRSLTQCIVFQGSTGDATTCQLRDMTATNCLFYTKCPGPTSTCVLTIGTQSTMVNCTIATLAGVVAPSAISRAATTTTLTNTALIGFTAETINTGTLNGSNNATSLSAASSVLPSTGLQTDVVAATEFMNVTDGTEDFRLAATSIKLRNNGTATGAPSDDIVGTSRPL